MKRIIININYKKSGRVAYLYLLPTLILMFILLILPVISVIRYSFFDNVIINKNPLFIGFGNYIKVITDKTFLIAIKNTSFFVFSSIAAHLIIGMSFAILLNNNYLNNTTKAVFRVICVLPWMFTASVIAVLWKMILNPNGILNYILSFFYTGSNIIGWLGSRELALFSVTVINVWAGYPFYMVSILAGLQGISSDLYEASALDGANAVQIFFRITIPQLKPILISLIMLDFVWTLQQFAVIWMTTGGGPINATEVLSIFIYKQGFSKYQYSVASAAAVIMLVISTVVAIFGLKQQTSKD